jgi:hypothetical protein
MSPDSTSIETMDTYDGGDFKALAGHFHGELLASSRDDSLPQSRELQKMAEEGEADSCRAYRQILTKTNP